MLAQRVDKFSEGGHHLIGERPSPLDTCDRVRDHRGQFGEHCESQYLVLGGPSPVNRHVRYPGVVSYEFYCCTFDAEVHQDAQRRIEDLGPRSVGRPCWHIAPFRDPMGGSSGGYVPPIGFAERTCSPLSESVTASYLRGVVTACP